MKMQRKMVYLPLHNQHTRTVPLTVPLDEDAEEERLPPADGVGGVEYVF